MAADDLVEFRHRLCGMGLPRNAAAFRFGVTVFHQLRRAGVDLRRIHHAGQTAGRMALGGIDERESLQHAVFAGLLVPFVIDERAVRREPARRAEPRSDIDAQAALSGEIEPLRMRHRKIDHRGDAGQQQFRIRNAHAVRHAFRIGPQDRHVFVKRRIIQAGRADLVEKALVERFAGRMRVDIDEARHHHEAASVDGLDRFAPIVAAGKHDLAAVESDIAAGDIGVAVLCGVPGDDIVRVADDGDGHTDPLDGRRGTVSAKRLAGARSRGEQTSPVYLAGATRLFGSCK